MEYGFATTDKPILVTGASGFIASNLVRKLLQKGYRVRGSVTNLGKKNEHLLSLPNAKTHLQFVKGDLNIESDWQPAVAGCDYVFHVASPFPPYQPKHQNDIILPAVNGTKFVTQAAINNKVKRVVCTSSCLTLFFGNEDKQTVSEEDWGKVEKCDPYPKSKIMAEREFWEMYRRQDLTKQHTEMVTVLPALVMGPGLMLHKNSSEGIVVEILKGGFPGYPKEKTFVDFVDVRDVADGHIKAMFTPQASGQRIALAGPTAEFKDLFTILKKNFPQANVHDQALPIAELRECKNPVVEANFQLFGTNFKVDNSKSRKMLKMDYLPLERTLVDMAVKLYEFKGAKL